MIILIYKWSWNNNNNAYHNYFCIIRNLYSHCGLFSHIYEEWCATTGLNIISKHHCTNFLILIWAWWTDGSSVKSFWKYLIVKKIFRSILRSWKLMNYCKKKIETLNLQRSVRIHQFLMSELCSAPMCPAEGITATCCENDIHWLGHEASSPLDILTDILY